MTFSTLYTTLPHHLLKDRLIDLINRTFVTQYLACNEECAFFTSDVYNNHNLWSYQKVCDALVYLLYNIFIRFGTKLYRQTIGIPMGTNCAPLVADLFLFCYVRDFMKSLSRETQAVLSKLLTSYLTAVKNIGLDTMILLTKGTELTIFGQLKILMMFSINLNLKTFGLLNCLHMIFLHCVLRYLIIL